MSRVSIHGQSSIRTVFAENGTLLLDLLRQEGIPISAPCGGNGTCGKCQITLEQDGISRTVLACRTKLSGDCTITVPDTVLLSNEAEQREAFWNQTGRKDYGAAADLGTTTVVVRLFSQADGKMLGTESAFNAQMTWGADVISRVQYTMEHPEGLELLGKTIRRQTVSMLKNLCSRNEIDLTQVRELSVAGNTIMEHIFLGKDPGGIAVAPYTPVTLFDEGRSYHIAELPETDVYPAPCVSGYVGGDITAGLLSSELYLRSECSLFLDVGTNGEMALGGEKGFLCCSVACGPAFEGAEITCGMTSAQGAVRHVSWRQGRLCLDVIGDGKPLGICGSGLIDLLDILLKTGVVDGMGRLLPPEEAPEEMRGFLGQDENENGIFYLTEEQNLYLTAADVRKLQLAKAAVAAGIQVLLQNAGMKVREVKVLYIAGGFGDALDPESATAIGLIPPELKDRVVSLGNSALAGASRMVLEPRVRETLLEIQQRCKYLELSGDPLFTAAFVDQMLFEMEEA